jgi:hypothetical protein
MQAYACISQAPLPLAADGSVPYPGVGVLLGPPSVATRVPHGERWPPRLCRSAMPLGTPHSLRGRPAHLAGPVVWSSAMPWSARPGSRRPATGVRSLATGPRGPWVKPPAPGRRRAARRSIRAADSVGKATWIADRPGARPGRARAAGETTRSTPMLARLSPLAIARVVLATLVVGGPERPSTAEPPARRAGPRSARCAQWS